MGRPKGHRLTAAEKKRCRPKHARGGRKPGAQPDRKRTTKERRRPDPKKRPRSTDALEIDALKAGSSIVTAKTLQHPTFMVRTPAGVRIETLEPDKI